MDFKAQGFKPPDWALASLGVLSKLNIVIRPEMLEAALAARLKGEALAGTLTRCVGWSPAKGPRREFGRNAEGRLPGPFAVTAGGQPDGDCSGAISTCRVATTSSFFTLISLILPASGAGMAFSIFIASRMSTS